MSICENHYCNEVSESERGCTLVTQTAMGTLRASATPRCSCATSASIDYADR